MPKLKCSVEGCHYNQNNLCSRNTISVDGPESFSKTETECSSYAPRGIHNFYEEYANFEENLKPETEVYCDAEFCVFQRNAKCYADKIVIKEPTDRPGAKSHHETMCKTFECVDNIK